MPPTILLIINMQLLWGPYLCKDGRKRCDVKYAGRAKPKTVLWARYKLENKLGRPLNKNETVDHKDDNKANDRLSNLQILSLAENSRKSANPRALIAYTRSIKGRQKSKARWEGQKNINAKLTDAIVVELRALAKRKTLVLKDECSRYGVTRKALHNALTGTSYSHLPGALEPKAKTGRPTTHTDAQIAKWVNYRRKGYTWAKISEIFGVNVTTVIKKAGPLV